MFKKYLLGLSIVIVGLQAHAEKYFYQGFDLNCRVQATRQEIGVSEEIVGTYYQAYGFQLFKSESYDPRMTAFATGTPDLVKEMIQAGGVPNPKAQINWTVLDDTVKVQSALTMPNMSPLPIAFGTVTNGDRVLGELKFVWSLEFAQAVLESLGVRDVPDFAKDKPVVSWTDPNAVLSFQVFGYGWTQQANKLPAPVGVSGHNGSSEVQIHYPADQHNGTSYHIIFECGKT